jgi:hypothetical protein
MAARSELENPGLIPVRDNRSVSLRDPLSLVFNGTPGPGGLFPWGKATHYHFVSRLKIVGHAVALWLRHYATSRKAAGSIPDEVNEFVQFT